MIWKMLTEPTATKVVMLLLIQFGVLCVLLQHDTKYLLKTHLFPDQMSIVRTGQTISRMQNKHLRPMKQAGESESILKTIRERTETIRNQCRTNGTKVTRYYPNYSRRQTLLSWIWMSSPYHELFYCATPKCGSTTWKSYLMEDLNITWNVDTHIAATQLGLYSLYKQTSLSVVDFLRQHRPKNRLLIVRNPWARLASAYDDKIVEKKWELKRLCAGWRPYANMTNPSFEQFIDCVLHSPMKRLYEAHTHPLTSLCAICHMDYNIILKLEEMHEAEPLLMKQLNFHIKPQYKPPRKMKNNKYRTRYNNITKKQIRQLQNVYKYDIELFHYPRTPFE